MLNTICQAIDDLKVKNRPICIAIDGRCGSGKTTLAHALQAHYNCNVFHMDDFFLPPKLRTPERYNEPGGNVDYVRFKKDVLTKIKAHTPFEYTRFNCKQMKIDKAAVVIPKDLSIIEGSYSMHPHLSEGYDLKIFLTIPNQIQLERIQKRNGDAVLQTFVDRWIPLENTYFDTFEIEAQSHFVFDTSQLELGFIAE